MIIQMMTRLISLIILLFANTCFVFAQTVSNMDLVDSLVSNSTIKVERRIQDIPSTAFTIQISNQLEFEALSQNLYNALLNGESEIKVLINNGRYFYKENQFTLEGWVFPDAKIEIVGMPNTELIGKGREYAPNEIIKSDINHYRNSFLINGNDELNLWSDIRFAADTIQVVDVANCICKLKLAEIDLQIEENKTPGWLVQITEWYYSRYCIVDYIHDGWLYFTVDPSALGWNPNTKTLRINSDYGFGKKMPRYRIFQESRFDQPVYESASSTWLNINNTQLGELTIKNMSFCGNKASGVLFNVTGSDNISIIECRFNFLHGGIVNVKESRNFMFGENIVENCQGNGVYCDHTSAGAQIVRNEFNNVCLSLRNFYAIKCEGSDFLIKENKIHNFGYGGIGVGLAWNRQPLCKVTGVIEGNELWCDPQIVNNPELYNLMDSGAIYTWTIIDDVIIRNNYVHDYNGMHLNRGIFCDDGGKNLTVYGNVVVRINNSFPIDLRVVNNVKDMVPDHNQNNKIFCNIVDAAYRFQSLPNNDSCLSASNVVLTNDSSTVQTVNNVKHREKDLFINYEMKGGRYDIHKSGKKIISGLYDFVINFPL